jgi:hypothetical protein
MVIVDKKGARPPKGTGPEESKVIGLTYCPGQTLASSFWNESQLCTEVDLGAPK